MVSMVLNFKVLKYWDFSRVLRGFYSGFDGLIWVPAHVDEGFGICHHMAA